MAKVDGGTLLARMLAAEGVKCVFSVSGGSINPLYRGCDELGIRVIHTRHEAAAAFMADGWARTSRQPGICATTAGPGVCNTVTAAASALHAASPMIILSGQCSTGNLDMNANQSNPFGLMTPVTKWARTVLETRRIPEYIATAFRIATSGRPGPVFLEFPADVMATMIDEATVAVPTQYRTTARPLADPNLIQQATELLKDAQRPVVVVGSGAWWSDAGEELRAFLKAAQVPVFLARMARGIISEDHPLYFGVGYVPANPVFEQALRECDLVILIGHRFDYDMNHGRAPVLNEKAKAIVIDVEPEEIGRFRSVEIGIIADAKMALSQLSEAVGTQPHSHTAPWLRVLEEARLALYKEQEPHLNSMEKPIHPLRFVGEVKKALPKEAIVVTGHGAIDFWADPVFQTYLPGHYLRAGQEGPIGAEIPYAVAAKLAHPDKPVLVLVGDSAFGYHCMEFDTAQRYQAPIVCVIGNDCSWGAIAHEQVQNFGRSIATSMPLRNYEKIVEILGGYGETVTEPTEIGPALRRAFESGVPACLNVAIKSLQCPYLVWRRSFGQVTKR